ATTANSKYNVNVWVELMAPVPADARAAGQLVNNDEDTKQVRLMVGNTPAYRILLADETAPALMRAPDNTLGDPGASVKSTHVNWNNPPPAPKGLGKGLVTHPRPATIDTTVVLPFSPADRFNGQDAGNVGIYVVGATPGNYDDSVDPALSTTIFSNQMTYTVDALPVA